MMGAQTRGKEFMANERLGRLAWHAMTQNRRLLRAHQRRLLKGASNRRILEVGSGRKLAGRDFQSAVDLAPSGAHFVMTDSDPSRGHRLLDIQAPDPAIGRFDIVLCCNVLEHVPRLEAAVEGLADVCVDDGEVFASTPYVYPYHDEPHDYWRPTSHGLRILFEKHFSEVSVSWTGLRRFPFQIFVHARGPLR